MVDAAGYGGRAPDVLQKWGKPVAERGFAQIPNYLLLVNQFLDKDHRLTPVELLVLFQLVGMWWQKDELPFPSIGNMAIRCGVSDRQINRAVAHLTELGLIRRVSRRTKGIIASNAYDMQPLVDFLEAVSKVYPNQFPRTIDKEKSSKVSSLLKRAE